MKTLQRIGLLATGLGMLLSGCTALPVQTDYDPATDFATLETYAWLERTPDAEGDPRVAANPLLHRRIHAAIDAGLQSAGYTLTAPGEADFLVSYYITVDKMTSVTYINRYWDYAPGRGGRYYHRSRPGFYPVFSDPVVYEYEQGTLILDISRPQGRTLVWRGSASSELDYSATPEQRHQKLNNTVNAILAEFPPR